MPMRIMTLAGVALLAAAIGAGAVWWGLDVARRIDATERQTSDAAERITAVQRECANALSASVDRSASLANQLHDLDSKWHDSELLRSDSEKAIGDRLTRAESRLDAAAEILRRSADRSSTGVETLAFLAVAGAIEQRKPFGSLTPDVQVNFLRKSRWDGNALSTLSDLINNEHDAKQAMDEWTRSADKSSTPAGVEFLSKQVLKQQELAWKSKTCIDAIVCALRDERADVARAILGINYFTLSLDDVRAAVAKALQ